MSVPRKRSPKPSLRAKKSKSKLKLYPDIKINARIPRQLESAASLWLDLFQQFCDIVIDRDSSLWDAKAIERARILSDLALETFQNRFPGVDPQ